MDGLGRRPITGLPPVAATGVRAGESETRSPRARRCIVDVAVERQSRPDLYTITGQVTYGLKGPALATGSVELLSLPDRRSIEVAPLNELGEFTVSCRVAAPSVLLVLPSGWLCLELSLEAGD